MSLPVGIPGVNEITAILRLLGGPLKSTVAGILAEALTGAGGTAKDVSHGVITSVLGALHTKSEPVAHAVTKHASTG